MNRPLLLLAAVVLGTAPVPSARAATVPAPYALAARWAIGGEGGWDILTVDGAAHRLYFGRSTRVVVVDTQTGKVAGEVPDTPGIHGVALVPELGRGFTSNGRDSTVTIFDLKTLAPIARVRLDARNPDAILYEPVTKRVFVMNGGSHNATAIEPATGAVLGNIELGGQPEFAVADGRGRVFVNLEDSSAVVSFDARTLEPGPRWSLGPGQGPTGIALDAVHRRLFSACSNHLMIVLDADNGRFVDSVSIGRGPDGAEFDPASQLAFSSNFDGTLTIVHEDSPDRYHVVANVETQFRARTLALDPLTHRIYLATARFGDPPPPTAEQPRPRPPMIPDSFEILVLEPAGK